MLGVRLLGGESFFPVPGPGRKMETLLWEYGWLLGKSMMKKGSDL